MTFTERWLRRAREGVVAALVALAAGMSASSSAAQVRISAGVLVHPSPSIGSTRVGPLVSAAVSGASLGLPLFVEAGVARTQLTSLGQDYHHNFVLLSLGAEWFLTRSAARIGLRLGAGAVGEFEVIETKPPAPGGGGWVSALAPGLTVERNAGAGHAVVLELSDYVLDPLNATFDHGEYRFEHRVVIAVGVRF